MDFKSWWKIKKNLINKIGGVSKEMAHFIWKGAQEAQSTPNSANSPLEESCHTCSGRFKCIDPKKEGCEEWA